MALKEVIQGDGITGAEVRVPAQPHLKLGPVHQTLQVVNVGLLKLRDVIVVQVNFLQVIG